MQAETPDTILVASGDTLQRSAVAKYLRECGYRVIEATALDEAKLALEKHPVDILVADAVLAGGTGFELSTHVRARGSRTQVLLTQSLTRTAELAGDLCEQGPLDQPYHPRQLVDEVRRLRASRR